MLLDVYSEGERYYLRLLLNHIKGLIDIVDIYQQAIQEAAQSKMPYALRQFIRDYTIIWRTE